MSSFVLAIDQGTTGSTCLVVAFAADKSTRVVARGYAEIPQHFPQPGWVEHDLEEIWTATCQAIRQALDRSGVKPAELAAIGITNQRETTGLWDTSGKPVHKAIVWQDRRTAERCGAFKARGLEAVVRARTGLVLDPYFSGTKLAWLLDEVPALRARAQRGELRFGTMDSWLVWKLTGGVHVTDATNAGRTLLFDIHRGAWDAELCAALGDLPRALLPEVRDSSAPFGKTRGAGVLPDGIPITGIAGDQHAALFGQACLSPGSAKCTYGTGAFALVNTGSSAVPSQRGLLTTIAWQLGGARTYALEGSVFVAGAIVQWLRDGLGIIAKSEDIEPLARSVPDSGGVILVPALTGLGAPHWRAEARGAITGITRGTERGHLARAALEGIALSVYDLLDAMRLDSGLPIRELKVDGGASANDLLMQLQADLLRTPLHRPHVLDTTALGAAYFAALGAGIYADLTDVARGWALDKAYTPAGDVSALGAHIQAWHAAVAKA